MGEPKGMGRLLDYAVLTGLIAGIIDAATVGTADLAILSPVSIWLWIPFTWIAFCVAAVLPFLIKPLRRFAWIALWLAGPGLLLLATAGRWLIRVTTVGPVISVLACFAVALIAGAIARMLVASHAPTLRLGFIFCAIWLVGCGGLGLTLLPSAASRQQVRATPGAPNVVMIFLDTLRYDDAQEMPNLTRMAKNGVNYSNAWSAAPWTLPSHFAMLTGEAPWNYAFDSATERFSYPGATLAQRLRDDGYSTAAVFSNPLLGNDPVFRRGFQEFAWSRSCAACRSDLAFLVVRGLMQIGVRSPLCVGSWMPATEVADRATHFIHSTQRPYFLALNFMDAHTPYPVSPSCGGQYDAYTGKDWKRLAVAYGAGTSVPADSLERLHSQYKASLRCMDRTLGNLFNDLQRSPDWKNTVVAVAADHGEQFGAHGLVLHGQSLYPQLLHVPFFIIAPGLGAQRVDDPVTTLDVAGQILSLIDHRPMPEPHPVIAALVPPGTGYPLKTAACAVGDRRHLIRWIDGKEAVYDYRADPHEENALHGDVDDETALLRSQLATIAPALKRNERTFTGIGYIQ